MAHRLRTALVAAGLGFGLVLVPTSTASAHDREVADDGAVYGDHQHGAVGGHLPATSKNVQLVGKVGVHDRGEGRVADVGVLGNFAYEAAFNSPTCVNGGVYVFDISKLKQPKEIGFIPTPAGSFVGEGIQAEHVKLASGFRGDLLLFNNEICDATQPAPVGGATLVDVSDPYYPKVLASGFGDVDDPAGPAHAVHSAYIPPRNQTAASRMVTETVHTSQG
jgi:hypothetical protein